MITPLVAQEFKNTGLSIFCGRVTLPAGVCSHCGEQDDPEWLSFDDADGDRICYRCGTGDPKALVKFNPCVDCQIGTVGSWSPATGFVKCICQTCRDHANLRVAAAYRVFATVFDLIAA